MFKAVFLVSFHLAAGFQFQRSIPQLELPVRSFLQRPVNFATGMTRARRNIPSWTSATTSNADTNTVEPTTGSENKNGAWIPIGSAKILIGDVPVSIELIGEKFVAWRNGTTWSVMRDVCPHRLAPLSQGRVDPTTGCIECPYHGWQFASNGACTKIPQLPPDQRRVALGDEAMDRTGAISFPVRMTGDMVWAFLPLPPGQVIHAEAQHTSHRTMSPPI